MSSGPEVFPAIITPTEEVEISVALYENVVNAKELRQLLMTGNFECALLKTDMIVDVFQVLVAAFKALKNEHNKKMSTRNIFTEIVYNLSCKKSISGALKTFGIQDDSTSILAVFLRDPSNKAFQILNNKIEGSRISTSALQRLSDHDAVCKEYKISDMELTTGSLIEAIIGRITTREFVAY